MRKVKAKVHMKSVMKVLSNISKTLSGGDVTFSAAHMFAQLEFLNVSVPPASYMVDLQTLYNAQEWDPCAGF